MNTQGFHMKMTKPPSIGSGLMPLMLAAVLVAASGCARTPKPTEKMAVAEASVKRASTDTTSDNAGGELQIAIAKLESAKQAIAREDYAGAARFAEQAEIDAQVAELHAQSTQSRKAAQESQGAARALHEEIYRKTVR